jgi:hypothetical protein
MAPTNLYPSVRQAVVIARTTQSLDPLSYKTRRIMFWSLNSKNRCAVGGRKIRKLNFLGSLTLTNVVRYAHSLPPSLTPAAMKKLVERRNVQFCDAVNESVHVARRVFSP